MSKAESTYFCLTLVHLRHNADLILTSFNRIVNLVPHSHNINDIPNESIAEWESKKKQYDCVNKFLRMPKRFFEANARERAELKKSKILESEGRDQEFGEATAALFRHCSPIAEFYSANDAEMNLNADEYKKLDAYLRNAPVMQSQENRYVLNEVKVK